MSTTTKGDEMTTELSRAVRRYLANVWAMQSGKPELSPYMCRGGDDEAWDDDEDRTAVDAFREGLFNDDTARIALAYMEEKFSSLLPPCDFVLLDPDEDPPHEGIDGPDRLRTRQEVEHNEQERVVFQERRLIEDAILEAVAKKAGGATDAEITTTLLKAGLVTRRENIRAILVRLAQDGSVVRSGSGVGGSPFVYCVAAPQ